MLARENYVNYFESRLHYARAGHGSTPLLIFHGFGQDHQVFETWVKTLEDRYQLFVFDLYFHGQSTWPGRNALEKEDWERIMSQFFDQEGITTFEVAGFSLGGKFALATVEEFPERVKRIILLAPDGIRTSPWYSLATYPIAIRSLFKSMVLKPGRFQSLALFFRGLGLVNKGILRFAESQMDTEEKRRRVYFSWVYFRHLKFNIGQMTFLLNQFQVPLLVILGKYDKVIPAKKIEQRIAGVTKKRVEVIEAGHNDLVKSALPHLL